MEDSRRKIESREEEKDENETYLYIYSINSSFLVIKFQVSSSACSSLHTYSTREAGPQNQYQNRKEPHPTQPG